MIDMEKLGEVIILVEQMFEKEKLNHLEKDLVVRELNNRLLANSQVQKTRDLRDNLLPNWVKKVMGDKEKEDKDDERPEGYY